MTSNPTLADVLERAGRLGYAVHRIHGEIRIGRPTRWVTIGLTNGQALAHLDRMEAACRESSTSGGADGGSGARTGGEAA